MIFRVVVYGWACDYPTCSEAYEDADARGRAEVWKRLRSFGWTQRGGKYFCPEHSGGTLAG